MQCNVDSYRRQKHRSFEQSSSRQIVISFFRSKHFFKNTIKAPFSQTFSDKLTKEQKIFLISAIIDFKRNSEYQYHRPKNCR